MKTFPMLLVVASSLAVVLLTPSPLRARPDAEPEAWPSWRGASNTGVAPSADPPVKWSEEKNIRWKFDVPGSGTSTPVVWGDRLYVTTAMATGETVEPAGDDGEDDPEERRGRPRRDRRDEDDDDDGGDRDDRRADRRRRGRRRGRRFGRRRSQPEEVHRFAVLALDRATGKVVWNSTATEEVPHEGHHPNHGYASASPVTDGEHLFVSFGSRGIYCLDLDGQKKWKVDLGDMETRRGFGEGSSPALSGDTLVVNWDHEGDSFIVALDKKSGDERWRRERDERSSWTTPVIVEADGGSQVIVNGTNRAVSYDLESGETLWTCRGQTSNVIPTPVVGHGMVYLMSGFRGAALQAVELSARGEVTESNGISWSLSRGTPYVPSPLLYGDHLYFFSGNDGILSCHDARTGEAHVETRRFRELSGVYASPLGAGGRVYLVGRRGTALVIEDSPDFEVLATNELDDNFDASPVAAGKELFLRGHEHLYCIAAD